MRVKSKRKAAVKPAPAPAVRVGAASALTRLETEEASLFSAYETAKAGGDGLEIKIARDAWIKVSESLRRFDLMLEAARRETGELIPRADVERYLSNVGSCLHYALLDAVNAQDDRGDLEKVYSVCDSAFTASIRDYDPKRSAPVQEVPMWMAKALFQHRGQTQFNNEYLNHTLKNAAVICAFRRFRTGEGFEGDKAKEVVEKEFARIDAEHPLPPPKEDNSDPTKWKYFTAKQKVSTPP